MKRLVLLFGLIGLFASCDKPENKKSPLTPDEQKVKIEQVAEDLMDMYSADVFEDYFKLTKLFGETYFDYDYDWDDFYEYCEEKGEKIYNEDWSDRDGYTTDVLFLLSDLQGKIVFGPRSVSCSDYKGLAAEFSLDGKDYVAEVTFPGKKTTVDFSYTEEGYYYDDTYNVKIEIPETVKVKITENGKNFAEVTCSVSFPDLTEDMDPEEVYMYVSTSIKIDDNELIIDRTGYDAGKNKAISGMTLKKGNKVAIKSEISADVDMDVEVYGDEVYQNLKIAKNAYVYVDILGEMQFKGECSDMLLLADYIEDYDYAETDAEVERAIKNINNQLDLGLYYNGSSKKTADVVIDYYVYYDEYWDEEWEELGPVLVFDDGSKYSFYEYFDEDAFAGLIDSFELWIEMYETMLEHYFDY